MPSVEATRDRRGTARGGPAIGAILLLLAPALAACAPRDDGREALCRAVLARIEASPPPLAAVRAVREGDAVVLFWTVAEGEGAVELALRCGFAPAPAGSGPPRLETLVLPDGEPLGPAALVLLETVLLAAPPASAAPVAAAAAPLRALLVQQAINGAGVAGAYVLLATAFTLVWSLLGRLHLALGDLAALGAGVALVAVVGLAFDLGLPLAPALALALAAALATSALAGAVTGARATRGLWASPGLAPLVATLGLSLALREGQRLAAGARERWLPPFLGEPALALEIEGFTVVASARQLLTLAAALLAWAAIHLLLQRTRLGRCLRAAADDPGMLALLGVDPDRLRRAGLALAAAAAAAAGTVLLSAFGTLGPEAGFLLGLKGLVAAVVGGLGSVHGAALGGLAIAALETGWTAVFGGAWRDAATFGALAFVLLLRPHGIIARPLPHPGDRFRPR